MTFQFRPFDPPAAPRRVLRQSFFARGRIGYRSDKILPNGLAVAIFNLGAPHRLGKSMQVHENRSFAHSWLHGVQTTPIFNTPESETHVFGLLFEPIGLHALLGLNMPALVDRTVDAREILPEDLVLAVEALLPEAANEKTHARLHRILLDYPVQTLPNWLWAFYETIREEQGAIPLAEAYAAIGHSSRHINACFKRAVGVSPKVLCRIYRLQALLAEIDPSEPVNWTALAHRFDFYDQAHFNREFRSFAGLRPGEYLLQRRRNLPELGKGESVSFAPQA